MDTENDICRHCECSGHVTESDCDECSLTMAEPIKERWCIGCGEHLARITGDLCPQCQLQAAQSELAALRSKLERALAALEGVLAHVQFNEFDDPFTCEHVRSVQIFKLDEFTDARTNETVFSHTAENFIARDKKDTGFVKAMFAARQALEEIRGDDDN